MRPIREGDTVDFVFGCAQSFYDVVVLSTPADTGDFWCFEDEEGNTYGLNPCCQDLHYVLRKKKGEKCK